MDIVILLFDRFEPLDAIGPYEILAHVPYSAVYTSQRVVRHDRIITSAGVSSGIDMALRLAALLADETTAQAIQLYTEYDPQPPFDSGSMAKVSPQVLARAGALGLASAEVLERARVLG